MCRTGERDMTSTASRRSVGRGGAGAKAPPELPPPDGLEQLPLTAIDGDLVLLHWPMSRRVSVPGGLSAAERAVAALAARGLTHDAIAHARRRSLRTVGKQLSSIYRKLNVGSRAELIARMAGPRGPGA